jgi:hypothetical protein
MAFFSLACQCLWGQANIDFLSVRVYTITHCDKPVLAASQTVLASCACFACVCVCHDLCMCVCVCACATVCVSVSVSVSARVRSMRSMRWGSMRSIHFLRWWPRSVTGSPCKRHVFYAFYAWWVHFPQSGALAVCCGADGHGHGHGHGVFILATFSDNHSHGHRLSLFITVTVTR